MKSFYKNFRQLYLSGIHCIVQDKTVFKLIFGLLIIAHTLAADTGKSFLAAPPTATKTYQLVTSTGDLVAGSRYLIASTTSGNGVAMGKQNTNNRDQVAITVSGSNITAEPASGKNDDKPFEIELQGSSGAWVLYDPINTFNLGPAAGSNGSNHLKENTNATYTITFSGNKAVMTAVTSINSNGRNIIRYNSSSSLFSSYAIGQNDIYLYKEVLGCTAPTTAPTNFSTANITKTSMDVSWTNGNGDMTLVVARAGGAVNSDPESGTSYTANAAFGSGSKIGTDNYVVYKGTGSTVTTTNLTAGTTYHYAIYTYNSADNCYNLTKLTGNATTLSPKIQLQYPLNTDVACGFTLGFGDVNTNTSVDLTFYIKNTGNTDLNVSALNITGADAALFSLVSPPSLPFVVTAGNTQNITVRFSPTTTGNKSASLSITNDDSSKNPCSVSLTGKGVVADLYYRTKQTGSWSDVSTWESSADNISWANATSTPSSTDYNITVNHSVTLGTSKTIDQTVISVGASLEVTNGTLTIANGAGDDLQVYGTLKISGNNASISTTGNIVVKNGGLYQHNVQTAITRVPTATWEAGSTCEIIGYTSTPSIINGGYDQNFYNFTWNCSSQTAQANLAGKLQSIAGDFTVQNTGTTNLRMIGGVTTVTVGGDLIVGVNCVLNTSETNSACTIKVSGDVSIYGNITELSSGTGSGVISFVGSNQSLYVGSAGSITNTINFEINNNSTVDVLSDITMPNDLILTSGNFVLGSYDLTVLNNISGGSTSSYVKTNGTGSLRHSVSLATLFPIGNGQYNPVKLTTTSTSQLGARVIDAVYSNGLSGSTVNQDVVNRTWDITGNLSGSMTIEPFWASGDENPGFDRTECYVSHYTGSQWEGSTKGAASGSPLYSRVRSGITSLSPFAIGSKGVLPVTFTTFDAKPYKNKVLVTFSTASEFNNEYFDIERSVDGRNFESVGIIKGVGNSLREQRYSFIDENPYLGISFYRIKQVDFDGKVSYTATRSVHLDNNTLTITPRNTDGRIDINTNDLSYEVHIYNTSGQEVRHFSALSGTQSINIESLLPGLYYVEVNGTGIQEIVKIVKY